MRQNVLITLMLSVLLWSAIFAGSVRGSGAVVGGSEDK